MQDGVHESASSDGRREKEARATGSRKTDRLPRRGFCREGGKSHAGKHEGDPSAFAPHLAASHHQQQRVGWLKKEEVEGMRGAENGECETQIMHCREQASNQPDRGATACSLV